MSGLLKSRILLCSDLYQLYNVAAVAVYLTGQTGTDDLSEAGVQLDVLAGHGPDDVDAVLPGHAGNVAQTGIV